MQRSARRAFLRPDSHGQKLEVKAISWPLKSQLFGNILDRDGFESFFYIFGNLEARTCTTSLAFFEVETTTSPTSDSIAYLGCQKLLFFGSLLYGCSPCLPLQNQRLRFLVTTTCLSRLEAQSTWRVSFRQTPCGREDTSTGTTTEKYVNNFLTHPTRNCNLLVACDLCSHFYR